VYEIDINTGRKVLRWDLVGGQGCESLLFTPDGTTLYSTADRDGFTDLCTITLQPNGLAQINFVHPTLHSGFGDIEALGWGENGVQGAGPAVKSAFQAPQRFRLYQNRPNPFNPTTMIEFDMTQAGDVQLSIYDVSGHRVISLLKGYMEIGHHYVDWNGKDENGNRVPSGVYFYNLRHKDQVETRRMVLLK
jgi:hypothetical protein